ncbi:hypothetical protein CDL15_Pgr002866 [Punica granatum]|uniref:CLAVATA3/ESR (CLE)-related protein 5-like n=1 Tax=Punica granatum TaxID=22663 RepID=A0A218X0J5_PUNGR|nr:hypothetical protein CDL15_Pgr002866 [Punica granatum]
MARAILILLITLAAFAAMFMVAEARVLADPRAYKSRYLMREFGYDTEQLKYYSSRRVGPDRSVPQGPDGQHHI